VITVDVALGERGYPVLVGYDARARLGSVLPAGTRRVAVVTQATIPLEVEPGVEHRRFEIGDGEPYKRLSTVEELCRGFAAWGLTRADCVVGVGGGLVTDVAGFAASVYHRGMPVVQVPTTLLGMVDAAIGGKTGVNLAEGKNLVGAFWQPAAVLCDLDALATLPPRELACGRGEMAKYHFLTGDDLLSMEVPERVARCVAIKAEVVAGDERESLVAVPGRRSRAILNYGHTLAHALETAGIHDLRHGEAVAIGLIYAAHLARVLERIDDARVVEHYDVLAAYGLDGRLPAASEPEALIELFGRDKKSVDGITFVLDGPAGVEVVAGIDRSMLLAAFDRMERQS
jgi:5-deoxy-5-amino-3-dehydroquinate synthase